MVACTRSGLQNIRQQMAQQNARGRSAQRTRGEHVLHFLSLQNLSAREPCVARPPGDDERENHLVDARAEERRERNRQQDPRKRKKRVDEHDVHEVVEPAADVARKRADRKADGARAADYAHRDQHRDARAEDNAREDVAAEIVGAHPVPGARTEQARRKILRDRVVRSQPGRGQRDNHQKQRERKSPAAWNTAAQKVGEFAQDFARQRFLGAVIRSAP